MFRHRERGISVMEKNERAIRLADAQCLGTPIQMQCGWCGQVKLHMCQEVPVEVVPYLIVNQQVDREGEST